VIYLMLGLSGRSSFRNPTSLLMNKAGLGLRFPALAIEKNRKNGARNSFGATDAGSSPGRNSTQRVRLLSMRASAMNQQARDLRLRACTPVRGTVHCFAVGGNDLGQ
jgi:hypothetical protein